MPLLNIETIIKSELTLSRDTANLKIGEIRLEDWGKSVSLKQNDSFFASPYKTARDQARILFDAPMPLDTQLEKERAYLHIFVAESLFRAGGVHDSIKHLDVAYEIIHTYTDEHSTSLTDRIRAFWIALYRKQTQIASCCSSAADDLSANHTLIKENLDKRLDARLAIMFSQHFKILENNLGIPSWIIERSSTDNAYFKLIQEFLTHCTREQIFAVAANDGWKCLATPGLKNKASLQIFDRLLNDPDHLNFQHIERLWNQAILENFPISPFANLFIENLNQLKKNPIDLVLFLLKSFDLFTQLYGLYIDNLIIDLITHNKEAAFKAYCASKNWKKLRIGSQLIFLDKAFDQAAICYDVKKMCKITLGVTALQSWNPAIREYKTLTGLILLSWIATKSRNISANSLEIKALFDECTAMKKDLELLEINKPEFYRLFSQVEEKLRRTAPPRSQEPKAVGGRPIRGRRDYASFSFSSRPQARTTQTHCCCKEKKSEGPGLASAVGLAALAYFL